MCVRSVKRSVHDKCGRAKCARLMSRKMVHCRKQCVSDRLNDLFMISLIEGCC
jgi:hypothetical protein